MAKHKKFKQSSTRTLANPLAPTAPIIPHSLIDKDGYYRVDEYSNIVFVQQGSTPRSPAHSPTIEPDPMAIFPKAHADFDPIHLAMATKQLAKAQPKEKEEVSWSYTREAPTLFEARPSMDPIVNCPRCTRQLPRSRLEQHIDYAHLADPLVACPHCKHKVRQSRLERHILYKHTASPVVPMVPCPCCHAQVRQSNLNAHMAKVHQAQPAAPQSNAAFRSQLVDAVLRAIGKPEVAPAPIPPKATKVAPAPVLKPKVPNAIPVAARSLRTELTVCPICNVSVRSDRLDRHLRKVHQQANMPTSVPPTSKTANTTTGKDQALCPVCNVAMKPSKLAQHLLKAHKKPMPAMSAIMMNKVPGQRNQLPPHPNTNEKSQAAFDQAFHESRFGDKYVGLSRRESSGRFGSLPLYDDYGDEADAD